MTKQTKKVSTPLSINVVPPVVTVLGHVDHGKTTLLDTIRKTSIADREFGGITQRIGASSIEVMHDKKPRLITFIDTPGHEAFSRMRGRGTMAADIGILVVSAVEGVKPQTQESISLLLASGIPFIVVLTKVDLPTMNIEKVKQQLVKEQVMLEGLGGDVPVIEVSAKEGKNVKELLDLILLVWDMQPDTKKGQKTAPFKGIVIESKMDTKAGPRATVVVKSGTISLKDPIIVENGKGKARTIIDDKGKQQQSATVGDAVEILGFEKVPVVGGVVVHEHDVMQKFQEQEDVRPLKRDLASMQDEKVPALSLVLCADTQGGLEAISHAIPQDIDVILRKTGEVSEADILLAKSVNAIVLSFNGKIRPEVTRMAYLEKVLLKNYTIIYELIDEVKDVLEGKMLALEEKIFGIARVLASFPYEKTKVLGIAVMEGRIAKGDKVRLMHGEDIIGESTITSVRKGKDQVSKAEKGQEAGIILASLLDFTIGDMVISHG